MSETRSFYICDRCSKDFRSWRPGGKAAEVISPTPFCPRCTSKCRLLERDKIHSEKPKGPRSLEEVVQHAVSNTAMRMQMFPSPKKKIEVPKESIPSCALLEPAHGQEVPYPDSSVIGNSE